MEKINFTYDIVTSSTTPLVFDDSKCTGCNSCADVCQVDILVHSDIKGKHPVLVYPGECYYCGSCVMACKFGAINLKHPIMNKTKFIEVTKLSDNK